MKNTWDVRLWIFVGMLVATAAFVGACDQTDAASIKMTLKPDMSGTVMTSSVAVREAGDGPAQKSAGGVTWQGAGTIVMARGEFADVNKVNVGGIEFVGSTRAGDPLLRVTIPRGPDAKWPEAFTVKSGEARKAAAKTLDPLSKASTLGESIKIQIEVPGVVISAGASGKARGVGSTFEETLATLTVPVDVATSPGDPIVWHVTWKEHTVR